MAGCGVEVTPPWGRQVVKKRYDLDDILDKFVVGIVEDTQAASSTVGETPAANTAPSMTNDEEDDQRCSDRPFCPEAV